ncbi:MAG: hypothetical protein MUF37_05600, partial [Methanoregulaceae archaeon]|nr:hypothetical protein [Methanoregulaceae archaeon]
SVVTPEVTQNAVTKTVTKEAPVQTSTPSKVTNPVSTESIPGGNNSSFPWLTLVEIIIVIGLIGGVIILYYTRKGL